MISDLELVGAKLIDVPYQCSIPRYFYYGEGSSLVKTMMSMAACAQRSTRFMHWLDPACWLKRISDSALRLCVQYSARFLHQDMGAPGVRAAFHQVFALDSQFSQALSEPLVQHSMMSARPENRRCFSTTVQHPTRFFDGEGPLSAVCACIGAAFH